MRSTDARRRTTSRGRRATATRSCSSISTGASPRPTSCARPTLSRRTARGADITFQIDGGPQTIVDHIFIVGNLRTRPRRHPARAAVAGRASRSASQDRCESRRRLSALGLFRRDPDRPSCRTAAATGTTSSSRSRKRRRRRIGYGGGLEASRRLRDTRTERPGRRASRVRAARVLRHRPPQPRRKNRSVNLYTRVSLRPSDDRTSPDDGIGSGSAEYRIVGTYREPRAFGAERRDRRPAAVEQGVRIELQLRAQGLQRGRRSAGSTAGACASAAATRSARPRIFDEQLDRGGSGAASTGVFPQVRLSAFSGRHRARHARRSAGAAARRCSSARTAALAARAIGGRSAS